MSEAADATPVIQPGSGGKFRQYAWRYLVLFSVLYCTLYCCRLNLSNASALLLNDFGWDKSRIGILTGALFWAYAIGQAVNGRLSEIFKSFQFVVLGTVFSIAVNLLFSLQTSFLAMTLLWLLNGYFQSMVWTPGLACLTRWWPASTRGFATGFAHAFSGFGQAAATASVSLAILLMPAFSWRAAFVLPALVPLFALVLYLLFAKPTPAGLGLPEYQESVQSVSDAEEHMARISQTRGKLYPYRHLIGTRAFVVWMFVAFVTGFARYGLVTWIPLFFIDKYDIDITAGLLASLALPVGMGLGTFVIPWISDHLYLHNRLRACLHCSLMGACAVALFLLLDPRIAWHMAVTQLLLFLAGFAIYAVNGTAWAFATDLGGRIFSATAAGMLNLCAYMGAAIQSFIYGFLLDRFGWNMIFLTISLLCGIIAIISFFSAKLQLPGHNESHNL